MARQRDREQHDKPVDTAMESAREAAEAAGEVARAKAQTFFDTNKEALIANAEAVVGVLRSASGDLGSERAPLARFAGSAADRIESLCQGLEGRDLHGALDAVESYARREPALFLGGTFLAGLLAARFLKASGERQRGAQEFRAREWSPTPGYPSPPTDPRSRPVPAIPVAAAH